MASFGNPPVNLPAKPRIVFMGTPEFAVPALKTLLEREYPVIAVVTQPDRPKGRGRKIMPSPVKTVALNAGLRILQPRDTSEPKFCMLLGELKPDILIVVAFGQILKPALLGIPKWGALNIHASILPKYRGSAPIQWAVLNNDTETGLTAMIMDEGLDTGPIVAQKIVPIYPGETGGSLHDRLALVAGEFLADTLDLLAQGKFEIRPQDDSKATYAPKITKEMAEIDWFSPAEKIVAKIRAFDPWPGAHTWLNGKKVKLFSARPIKPGTGDSPPGMIINASGEKLVVAAEQGAVEVHEIQMPGKKRMKVSSFLAGNKIPERAKFQKMANSD